MVHNLIGYIGSTDNHLSSTTDLHSSHPTPLKVKGQVADQTNASQYKEEGEEREEERDGEKEEGERSGEAEGVKNVMVYEASPEVLKVEVEKWRSSLSYAIDSQDTETTQKVQEISTIPVTLMTLANVCIAI